MRTTFTLASIILLTSLTLNLGYARVPTYTVEDTKTHQTETVNHQSRLAILNWSDELRSLSVAEPSRDTNKRIAELQPFVPENYKDMFDRISRVLIDQYTAQTLSISY